MSLRLDACAGCDELPALTAQDLPEGQAKRRLTVEEFLLLDRERAFRDRRTELVAEDIHCMSPQFRPHGFSRDGLAYRPPPCAWEHGEGAQ
ncbi:hypothetical protein [Qipengyuania sediminis]|uniref:hypothetical protein n=1 Tax=Qipengyuania sediminis TaxID=1532023 RepID=UPI00105A9EC7|nr:hypothetical protein [Qipengyuania sediminis]